ncbi:peptidylprolyl isomerase [Candidatus Ichthyocystis hellenicum]|uniref:peptidylprolyl isomerase n=1 Tax=Candidatus Ichthyocystis hellenicum TaxID=1561003 RepID=UPI000B87DEDA|nr:peptidylprolyl isomerase [Candidatus Ichthyocystis hellenicum]
MKNKFLVAAVLGSMVFGAVAALPPGAVAVVNGEPISKSVLDFLMSQAPSGYLKNSKNAEEVRTHVKEQLIRASVIVQEARKRGFQNRSDVKIAQNLAGQDVIVRAFVKDYMDNHKPTDAQLRESYGKMKANMKGKELHLHHILVPTEKEAKMVAAKLAKGAKFDDLARRYSKDTVSKTKGGDLGWSSPAVYVRPFADSAESLKDGMTSSPVKTQFGWHIIKRDSSRDAKVPEFDAVKPQLEQMFVQEELQKYVESLRKSAKVEE